MSNSPYQPAPDLAPSPIAPGPSDRPTGVTVFAILCFVFGALGAIGLLSSVGMMMMTDSNVAGTNPVLELCRENFGYLIFTIVSNVIGLVFLVVQVVAGFKLLSMEPLGRKLILIYAVYAIIFAIVANIVNYFLLLPAIRKQIAAQGAGAPPSVQAFTEWVTTISMVLGFVFAVALPLAILWYFNRADIRARFAANETSSI